MGARRRGHAAMNLPTRSYSPAESAAKWPRARGHFAAGSSRLLAPNDNDNNWWMITFTDLTLLLLGFVVLWHATGKIAAQAPPAKLVQAPLAAPAVSPAEAQFRAQAWQSVRNDLSDFVAGAGLQNDVDIESTHDEILFSLRDSVPFASGKADLRPRALPVLEKLVTIILAHADLSVAISGHTDSLRIASAEFPSNWELSAARASRVARYLIEKGIHPARISVQGFANYRPRTSNSSAPNRRANRRVEIRLTQNNLPPGSTASEAR
jgi:chemotaxis protein MotB